MAREVIVAEKAPAAVGPYSQAIRNGDLLFTAGQLGLAPETRQLAGPDIESQTRLALENLRAILEAAGSCLRHVGKTTAFLVELAEWPRMNAGYAEFFPEAPPARVEIEAVAEVCDCPSPEACGCR